VAGERDGTLFAGGDPGVLFESSDGGATWALQRTLWEHPTRPDWQPGGGGLCLHSIVPWPGDPDRLALAMSAVGVWLTEDGGRTWSHGNQGLVAGYLPEDARAESLTLCVHDLHRSPARPERMFMQFHGGVYRSDDAGRSWTDVGAGLPSDFGFPMVVDPADPDSAYVIPLGRQRGPRDAGRAGARLRDARRRRDVDAPRRGAAPAARLPHGPAPGLRPRGRGRRARALLRRHLGRRLRLGRRGRHVGAGGPAPAARVLRAGGS
jgi:hypothetical protein